MLPERAKNDHRKMISKSGCHGIRLLFNRFMMDIDGFDWIKLIITRHHVSPSTFLPFATFGVSPVLWQSFFSVEEVALVACTRRESHSDHQWNGHQ